MASSKDIKPTALDSISAPLRFSEEEIRHRIYTIRGVQVMMDRDLAILYQVQTGHLNEAVKRNKERFPEDFMFQLTKEEWGLLKSQSAIANDIDTLKSQSAIAKSGRGGSRTLPFAFTEEGVSQLAGVLRSDVAVQVSVRVHRAFVAMRKFIAQNAGAFQRLDQVERHLILTDAKLDETNSRIDRVLDQMENGQLKHKLGIFFENQMFDAYVVVEEIVKRCTKRLVLIDDYVDGEVLERFRVRKQGATVDVYVQNIHQTRTMQSAFDTYHRQYPTEHVELHTFNLSHDRWLIVDDEVYHFGASIKDLGKKWFEVSRITEYTAEELIARLNN